MKKCLTALLATLLLFSCALAEETAFQPIPWTESKSPNLPHEDAYLPDEAGYHDDSIDITIDKFRAYDTTVMRVRVKIQDASQLRTSSQGKHPSKATGYVADMGKRVNAVIAFNGDWYTYHEQGIVYRNGEELRMRPSKGRDTLVMDEQGDLHILPLTHQEDWDAYINNGGTVIHTWTYGPGLVIDGVQLTDPETVRVSCGKNKETQRMAIGQVGPLEYLFLATEGPENEGSTGLTIIEMAQLCYDNGMINAYNLDGGSSSAVAFRNKKINSLSSRKNRPVGDCIWFATLVPGAERAEEAK